MSAAADVSAVLTRVEVESGDGEVVASLSRCAGFRSARSRATSPYVSAEQGITVLVVAHERQRPRDWSSRANKEARSEVPDIARVKAAINPRATGT